MPRIPALNPATAEGEARDLMEAVRKNIGMVPNLMRTMANQPAVLNAYVQFGEALSKGAFDAKTREAIALTVAGANSCDYCASAHSAISGMLKVHTDEIAANLAGQSLDGKLDAALNFTDIVVSKRGMVSNEDIRDIKAAGYGDSDIVEIIANVALNTMTNYINHVAETEIDFPAVKTRAAA